MMKTIHLFILLSVLPLMAGMAQRDIIIPTGAIVTVPAGAQLCADRYYANNPGYGTLTYGNDPARLCGAVIPVEFLSLSAGYHNGSVTVSWRTASETNCAGYEVQRSADQSSWAPIGYVTGHGTTLDENAYGYEDILPPALSGAHALYYRLRQIDNDGKYGYSPIVEAIIGGAPGSVALHAAYPNPTSDRITIRYSMPDAVSARIAVYSLAGEEVAVFNSGEISGRGEHILSVNTEHLPPGGYLIELLAGETRLVRQFVVQR
jgi:hypothetical protein